MDRGFTDDQIYNLYSNFVEYLKMYILFFADDNCVIGAVNAEYEDFEARLSTCFIEHFDVYTDIVEKINVKGLKDLTNDLMYGRTHEFMLDVSGVDVTISCCKLWIY